MGELKSASHYYRNNLLMSACFFLVFTAFSTLQNLMGAVLAGDCNSSNDGSVCTNEFHVNTKPSTAGPYTIMAGKVDTKGFSCATLVKDTKGKMQKVCYKPVGKCKNQCPQVYPTLPKSMQVETVSPVPEAPYCPTPTLASRALQMFPPSTATSELTDTNLLATDLLYVNASDSVGMSVVKMTKCPPQPVGNTAVAILYAFFTLCCIVGPLLVEILGAKWCMVVGFCMNTFFCVANVLVVWDPTSIVEEAVLYPVSALVGVCASFLWTAQGTYLTRNANFYADALELPRDQALGQFNGASCPCNTCLHTSYPASDSESIFRCSAAP
jgi:hypothetical protein